MDVIEEELNAKMIVSHKHKFIFLKTKKTAGTSIELALTKLCGDDDIITPLTAIDEAKRVDGRGAQNWKLHGWWNSPRPFRQRRILKFTAADYGFYNHMTAEAAKALLKDDQVWDSYFKFTFDRNPWDRQVSFYHHRFRKVATPPPPFAEFIHGDKRARLNNYEIYSIGGDVAVDYVGRYENLEDDLKHALSQIGVTLDDVLPHAKGGFRKDKRPYQDFYDDDTRDIVSKWYEREIKLLDYAF